MFPLHHGIILQALPGRALGMVRIMTTVLKDGKPNHAKCGI